MQRSHPHPTHDIDQCQIATSTTTIYKIYRTLVFPCGSGIGLEIADALKNLKEIELVGATSKSRIPTHCPYVFPTLYDDLPTLKSEERLRDRLIEIMNQERVDVLFPALDDATTFFAKHRDEIEASTNARVMLPPKFAVRVARSKKRTTRGCWSTRTQSVQRWRQRGPSLHLCF